MKKSDNFSYSRKAYKGQLKRLGPNIQDGRDAAYIDFNRRLIIMAKQKPSLEKRLNFCRIVHGNMIEFLHNREIIARFATPFCDCRDDFFNYISELGDFVKEVFHDLQEAIKSEDVSPNMEIPNPDPLHKDIPPQYFHDESLEEPYGGVYKPIHLIPYIDETSTVVQEVINVPRQFPWSGEGHYSYAEAVEESINSEIAFPSFRSVILYTNNSPEVKLECTSSQLNIWLPIETMLIYQKYNFIYKGVPDLDGKYQQYDYFSELRTRQMLIDSPYESYQMVVDFIDQMCHHPEIETIGITLYRVADNSAIVESLMDAIHLGKKVMIFLEIKARGNEAYNCALYRKFMDLPPNEQVNLIITPVYFEFKAHAKIFVAVTHDSHIYYHNGTGNYNEDTAKLYTDINVLGYDDFNAEYSLLKITNLVLNRPLSAELQPLIHVSESEVKIHNGAWNKLILSQRFNLSSMILCAVKAGLPIYIKCNHFLDPDIAQRVLEAAEAGCQVYIIARTSSPILDHPNIKIRSVIGDYLEHSRLYMIGSPWSSSSIAMIGSCDLLYRNLNKRVEHLCILETDTKIKAFQIFDRIWNYDQILPIQEILWPKF